MKTNLESWFHLLKVKFPPKKKIVSMKNIGLSQESPVNVF